MPVTVDQATLDQLYSIFPNLKAEGFTPTHEETWDYNCIAWSIGDNTRYWWPNPNPNPVNAYWPPYVLLLSDVRNFQELYKCHGYTLCGSAELEAGIEKVAIYAIGDRALHAARQLPDGMWTSKLGPSFGITHTLRGLEGGVEYGKVSCIMARTRGAGSLLAIF